MRIFDEIDRPEDDDGARHAESDFAYLNRSGRPEMAEVRRLYEDWFAEYPPNAQAEMRARLRKKDNTLHRAAFFELALHAYFRRLGYFVEVHPTLAGTSAHPDFLLLNADGNRVAYVEAVRAGGVSDSESKVQARIADVYDALDAVTSPDYLISVNVEGEPRSSIPRRAIREFVESRLRDVDAQKVAEQWASGWESVETWDYFHDGCTLSFSPIPKKPEFRSQQAARSLGVMSTGVVTITPAEDIRTAVDRKATKYGVLDLPFVIAVNNAGIGADRDATWRALLGTVEYVLGGDGKSMRPRPVANGAFIGPRGPRRTNVSDVLTFDYSHPSQIGEADIFWIPNPWAARPLSPPPLATAFRLHAGGDTGAFVDGESASSIFGIPGLFPNV